MASISQLKSLLDAHSQGGGSREPLCIEAGPRFAAEDQQDPQFFKRFSLKPAKR
jgi:hypothetical protein